MRRYVFAVTLAAAMMHPMVRRLVGLWLIDVGQAILPGLGEAEQLLVERLRAAGPEGDGRREGPI